MNILNNLKENSTTNINLENFINKNFQEIYDFFYNQTQIDLYKDKQKIKQYFKYSQIVITSLNCKDKINGDFIALLIETCEKLHLLMEFKIFYDYLAKSDYVLGNKLKASSYYRTNIRKFDDYYNKYLTILNLLQKSYMRDEESKENLTVTLINFYLSIVYNFGERNKEKIFRLKEKIFVNYKERTDDFLDESILNRIFSINIDDFKKAYEDGIQIINSYLYENGLITCILNNYIKIENSEYSEKLYQLQDKTFDEICKISRFYVENNIEDEKKIHYSLQRGTKILDDEIELYQYIKSFAKMHKAKLYSSFDKIIYKLNDKTINIVDWGCGQALATSLLVDYIKEQKFNIYISDITLIEPSSLALSRGLLHIDILKNSNINIKPVNKDIDCLEENDLNFPNSNITLHLFSNILDVELFKLDKQFLKKISNSQKCLNYFICISPNINDKRNARLDMFYRYFNDNFTSKQISSRDSDIGNYKRYEKIFKVEIN